MKILSLTVFIFSLTLFANEVSVFGAGDLESSDPYGLTSSEKVILKNKRNLTKFDRKIDDTRSNIDLLNERIDGIESIFHGDSRKLNSTVMELSTLKIEQKSTQISIDNLIETQKKNQKENIKKLNSLKEDLKNLNKSFIKLVKQINKDYTTKKQFDELVSFINKEFAKKEKKEKKVAAAQKSKKAKSKNFNKPNVELLQEAKDLFKKDYFTKAIPIFEYLIKKQYKPAESNFYLGEIWFHRKKYKDAVHHFKTSMMLYDKAKYIPKLLLHSAISFEKLNDTENAVNFYGTLIDVYPQTQEAKEAQQNIDKIK